MTARPEPLDLDLALTAVIVVDMPNDFGTEGGMFDRAGIDISPIKAIVPRLATSICVESTVRDAMFRDYVCVVLEDCTAEPIAQDAPRGNHEASLLSIELLFGWIAKASDLREALRP